MRFFVCVALLVLIFFFSVNAKLPLNESTRSKEIIKYMADPAAEPKVVKSYMDEAGSFSNRLFETDVYAAYMLWSQADSDTVQALIKKEMHATCSYAQTPVFVAYIQSEKAVAKTVERVVSGAKLFERYLKTDIYAAYMGSPHADAETAAALLKEAEGFKEAEYTQTVREAYIESTTLEHKPSVSKGAHE